MPRYRVTSITGSYYSPYLLSLPAYALRVQLSYPASMEEVNIQSASQLPNNIKMYITETGWPLLRSYSVD